MEDYRNRRYNGVQEGTGNINRAKIRLFLIKERLLEWVKFDLRPALVPLSLLLFALARLALLCGQYGRYTDYLSSLFRSGWAGGYWLVSREYRKVFSGTTGSESLKQRLIGAAIQQTRPLSNTRKFFQDPEKLFEGVVIVLKPATGAEKGVLLIKYSYYFTLMFKLFDMTRVAEHYHLVLEPSWAGFADMSILAYTALQQPVFVMTYERRDRAFISDLHVNLVPVDVGPSWWVDHHMFQPGERLEKVYDIIMVAAWDKFKRHHCVFRALQRLQRQGFPVRLAVVGYSTETTCQRILDLAAYYGIEESLSVFDKVSPQAVSRLFQLSRLNILWSRFEGNNRSIIEGMFCDVPAIVRRGHNYGEHYFYINEQTGCFSTERDLPATIRTMLTQCEHYSPRDFVRSRMSCKQATKVLEQAIAEWASPDWSRSLAAKVNELDGMRYLNPADRDRFQPDYHWLSSQRLPVNPSNR